MKRSLTDGKMHCDCCLGPHDGPCGQMGHRKNCPDVVRPDAQQPYASLPEPQRSAARRTHRALHVLWTKAVGTAGYDKREWRELDEAIQAIIHGGA